MRQIVKPNASLFISVAASCRHGTASGVAILVCLGPRLCFPLCVRSHNTPPPSRSERRLCGLVCKETRHRGQGGHAAWQGARTTTPSARCCHMTAQSHNATIANLVLFLAVNGTGSCHGNRLCSCAGPHMYLDDATLVNSDGVGLTRVVRGSNKS